MNDRAGITPKIFSLLRGYSGRDFGRDALAGVTVGLVALPLAMAFGIASGVTPQAGLYTAIVGGLVVALLGGSKTQIAGPTGAFVVIVAGILAKHGLSGLLMVTMMAGVMLVFLGVTGLGNAVKYIPRPVVIGFTNGIAVLIASTQLKDALGLHVAAPSEFFARMGEIGTHLSSASLPAVVVCLVTIAIIVLLPRVAPSVPAPIIALLFVTAATTWLHLPLETLGTRFGGIPSGFPPLSFPTFRADLIVPLLPSAFTVALLAAVESLLSAVVADSLTGDRHNSNAELVAQGAANILVPLVGGIPVTGAIARTGTNIRAGARSPMAAIVHSFTLLAIVLLFASFARLIPLAVLAAILLVVAYRIGEWREIGMILHLDKADRAVWLVTFALTVFADLTIAVEVGMGLAALLYIYRIAHTTTVAVVTPEYIEDGRVHVLQDKVIPPYVNVLRIHGPFLFGTTEQLDDETRDVSQFAPIVILRLRNMTAMDATGLHSLEELHERLHASGRTLILCGAREQPARLLERADFVDRIGRENIVANIDAALVRAKDVHDAFEGLGDEFAAGMSAY